MRSKGRSLYQSTHERWLGGKCTARWKRETPKNEEEDRGRGKQRTGSWGVGAGKGEGGGLGAEEGRGHLRRGKKKRTSPPSGGDEK